MESPDIEQKFHRMPWNFKSSMEFGYITKLKFHGTLVPPNGLSPSSIEFHGFPWNSGAAK